MMICDNPLILIKNLGTTHYAETLAAMQDFTQTRTLEEPDQCWVVSHYPVFTQGVAGKAEHILHTTSIPVVQSDRGGQVTYHGPGQLVLYWLCNLRRLEISPKQLVHALETGIIQTLQYYTINGHRIDDAPGVYVNNAKIASIGLRVKQGCSYHGISLNLDMDLTPFDSINACGYPGLTVTQVADQVRSPSNSDAVDPAFVCRRLIESIGTELGYAPSAIQWNDAP